MKINKEKLQIAMTRACMNPKDLQEVTQMPRPTLNNAICGRGIRTGTLGRIAKALNVDPTELIEGGD